MRRLVFLAMIGFAFAAGGQEAPPKKKSAKKSAGSMQAAHKKPTPEQIRRFNEAEKKQGR